MKMPDLNQAFPHTPDFVHECVRGAFEAGKRRARRRRQLTAALSAAAVLIVLVAVSVLSGSGLSPKPDKLSLGHGTNSFTPPETPTDTPAPTSTIATTATSVPSFDDAVWFAPEDIYDLTAAFVMPDDSGKQRPLTGGQDALNLLQKQLATTKSLKSPAYADPFYALYLTRADGVTGMILVSTGDTVYMSDTDYYSFSADSAEAFWLQFGLKPEQPDVTPEYSALPDVVYFTENGKFYHLTPDCTGMMNAEAHSPADAEKYGKSPCPTCLLQVAAGEVQDSRADAFMDASWDNEQTRPDMSEWAAQSTVYISPSGTYYHTDAACPKLKDALKSTYGEALENGLTACPNCAPDAEACDVPSDQAIPYGSPTQSLLRAMELSALERGGYGAADSIEPKQSAAFGVKYRALLRGEDDETLFISYNVQLTSRLNEPIDNLTLRAYFGDTALSVQQIQGWSNEGLRLRAGGSVEYNWHTTISRADIAAQGVTLGDLTDFVLCVGWDDGFEALHLTAENAPWAADDGETPLTQETLEQSGPHATNSSFDVPDGDF